MVKRRGKAIKIELEQQQQQPNEVNAASNATETTNKRQSGRKKLKKEDGNEKPLWQQHLENLEKIRETKDAPVDTVGCDMLGDVLSSPQTYRFQILVSLMLSSQTKDEVTAAAMQRLKARGCTVENILGMDEEELRNLLIPVGFYKVSSWLYCYHEEIDVQKKAIYLKKTASVLKEKYESDIPRSIKELCSLPGVGLKMANLTMQHAWDQIEGIGVDTHVHRIANRLGWVKTSTPEQTGAVLEALIPRERWATLNKTLVGFGQQTCTPLYPKCSTCLNKDICPAIGVKKKR
ncbi:unnamed protein product [Anisakis simplex]|uniref:Endonuclease III homolog n=1 Tax=Anisakis simplex TaxID=6269 RepID=A0A0M3K4R9_ANISI|nr:unnamed protein product [Anisakis simplex]